jgi:hypothetical protein
MQNRLCCSQVSSCNASLLQPACIAIFTMSVAARSSDVFFLCLSDPFVHEVLIFKMLPSPLQFSAALMDGFCLGCQLCQIDCLVQLML